MLPIFPEFKPLTLQDNKVITSITSEFLPFSDFNFVSLWAWNLDNKMNVSSLNQNLVVKFLDYDSSDPFFSFIGTNELNLTIQQLLDYSYTNLGEQTLKLIPEVGIQNIDSEKYNISVDRDNFDYIFKLDELRQMSGKKYSKRRNTISNLLKNIDEITVESLSLNHEISVNKMKDLFQKIDEEKMTLNADLNPNLPVFLRLLDCVEISDFISTGIYVKGALVAVLINELISTEYAVAHLMTADTNVHAGIYAYLMMQNAEILHQAGISFLNFEQDLGLQNLRKAKTLYRPTNFLKKYQLSYLHQQ